MAFSNTKTLVWTVSLSLVAVFYQFFLPGLTGDAPLYAYVARAMLESGEFFQMQSGLPEFQPFAEHPHLGYWIAAGFFKVFGAADWSFRLPGQLLYVGSLWVFWKLLKNHLGEGRAIIGTLMLWSWPLFSKFYANFYLDSGVIFCAFSAVLLWQKKESSFLKVNFACWAGVLLGLALLFKGVVSLAALFCFFLYALLQERNWRTLAQCSLGSIVPVALYLGLLAAKHSLDFVSHYLQSVERRAAEGSFEHFLSLTPYLSLLKETHGLILIVPLLGLFLRKRKPELHPFPLIWLGVFATSYLYTGRYAFQYWTTIMPALAWLSVGFLPKLSNKMSTRIFLSTGILATTLGVVLQVWPTPLRGNPTEFTDKIETVLQEKKTQTGSSSQSSKTLWVYKGHTIIEDFSGTGRVLWYTSLRHAGYIQPGESIPAANSQSAFWLETTQADSSVSATLSQQGWCKRLQEGSVSFWLECETQ